MFRLSLRDEVRSFEVAYPHRVIHMFEYFSRSEAHMSGMMIIFGGSRDNKKTIRSVSLSLREEAPCCVLWLFRKKVPEEAAIYLI